ncbi:MAG: hemolysin family protein, partial [Chloroflexota bacterium]
MSKLLLILGLPGVGLFGFALVAEGVNEGLPALTTLILPIIIISIAIVINGLFVAAEFAIIGVRPTQVEEMVENGNQAARHVMHTLISRDRQDHYIATAQMGITVSTLILGMYGEPAIAHFIEPYLGLLLGYDPHDSLVTTTGGIIAISLLTYLHVVIGEMIPKQLALSAASRAVIFLNGPMRFFQTIFSWPVRTLNGIGNNILRLIQVPPAEGHERVRSTDELEQIVSESAREGFLREEEEEWIINIFNFGDRQAQQVMTPRRKIEAIDQTASHEEILTTVSQSRYSRFPVYHDDLDHIIGILHMKELVRHQVAEGKFDLGELIQKVPVVPEHFPVEKLLSTFKRERIHMAVVLDEFGGTAGIVTLEDLIEEVVGEVRDEFDRELEPYVEVAPGILEVEGAYLIDDLIDDLEDLSEDIELGTEEALPDVDTIGGLVVAK